MKNSTNFKENDNQSDNIQAVLDATYEIIDALPHDDQNEYVWDGEEEEDGEAVMYAYAGFTDIAEMKKLVKKQLLRLKQCQAYHLLM